MEVVKEAVSRVIGKLGDLIADEYNLQMGLSGEISSLKDELESMQIAVEKVSNKLPDELDKQDRIWARDLRELSYDIQDKIDIFMVQGDSDGDGFPDLNGIQKFVATSVKFFSKIMNQRELATEIRGIKRSLEELSRRRHNFNIDNDVAKPITIDPRLFSQYKSVRELIGIDEARKDVIKILMEGNGVSKQKGNIVSIVGFGGLGKTTLANVVYEEIKTQFDCSAFVSVSQTPDMERLQKDMMKQLSKKKQSDANINTIVKKLTEFLQEKRYLIVLDDIWDLSIWKNIKSALPANDFGNRIITTTRSVSVAEEAGGAYNLKPLSLNNSRKLLYGRVFGNESNEDITKCPDMELAEVSDKILQKCAGVPLAIVTMASLLACKGRDKLKWYEVYKSVGTGLENSLDVNNMRKILSFSYYDMPSYLRTCLLYLRMFPEDSRIGQSHLIQLWIAEGFIKGTKPGESSFELGESYLNELINRSMIQSEYKYYYDYSRRLCCRVHDMVLDLLCSLSSEENFVTTSNDVVGLSPSMKVRRLSLQNSMTTDQAARQVASMNMKQVRSVVIFGSVELLPALSRFRVLRVLDLEECHIEEDSSLKYLGNLVHLRYLGLGDHSRHLPEEIGNLGFLQTLVKTNRVDFLPSSIAQLKHLTCIRVWCPEVPKGIGNLTSLEELSTVYIDSIETIEEMGNLTELRVLKLDYTDALLDKSFAECLSKLRKIKSLVIENVYSKPEEVLRLDGWDVPQHLRTLELEDGGFSTLPRWMNPSFLQHLSSLETYVKELHQEDFNILGNLPALGDLRLRLGHEWGAGLPRRFTAAAGSFPCLVWFRVSGYVQPLEIQQGAMPRLETLHFTLLWLEIKQIASISGGFDFGLRNLSSLKQVMGHPGTGTSKDQREEAEAAMRHELKTHPNQPTVIA